MNTLRRLLRFVFVSCATLGAAASEPSDELVYLDDRQIIRWRADDREVALFGANYCLPSSSDYRAAGYLGVDRKKVIAQDMAHFARMGWDGLRLALWGDWENCDREGNLIVNEHLDLLDYLIFRAKERGIFMLFTPIHRHSALWPDGEDSEAIQGFSKYYPPGELGRNPDAIRAQQNYLRQILSHVNPYTGVALKDEPSILFIEMINEPHHHAEDFEASVAYIDALVQAVRSTGCEKLLFHNLSQDFRMSRAIEASQVQGYSFGWYPTALVSGRTLRENYLRWVDRYTPLHRPETPRLPSIVYEFDSGDMLARYMYPAMVREFRAAGAQFAAMFAYDMLPTAPYNLGWQTHYLNLIYSPGKAVSAIIAAEAMRTLPRGTEYGSYPGNRSFGPFRVSYEEDSSEMLAADRFLYSNDTRTEPPDPAALRRIVGVGSSPIVAYEGLGSYFLERIADGRWRLEVYPDAVVVQDPFSQRLNHREVSIRLLWRPRPMQIRLPDLGPRFAVTPLNEGNAHSATATAGGFEVRPGVYLLSRPEAGRDPLPEKIGQLGFKEFVCPPPAALPLQAVWRGRAEYLEGTPIAIDIDVLDATPPKAVHLSVRNIGAGEWESVPMTGNGAFSYRALVPANALRRGEVECFATVRGEHPVRLPRDPGSSWRTRVVAADEPLVLFDAGHDADRVFALRLSGDRRGGYFRTHSRPETGAATLRIDAPASDGRAHAVSLPIKARVQDRASTLATTRTLQLEARGDGATLDVILVEADGTAWTATFSPPDEWSTLTLPLHDLRIGRGYKLPLGYPGNWNSELTPANGRGGEGDRLHTSQLEHIQFAVRRAGTSSEEAAAVEIALARLSRD